MSTLQLGGHAVALSALQITTAWRTRCRLVRPTDYYRLLSFLKKLSFFGIKGKKRLPQEILKDIGRGIVISCFIIALLFYIPVPCFFFFPLIPLPTLFFRLKIGRKNGAAVPVFSSIAAFLLIGKINFDMFFLCELLLLGFAMGEYLEKNISPEKTVSYTCGTVVIGGSTALFLYSYIYDIGIISIISEYVEKNLEVLVQLYKEVGVPEDTVILISDSIEKIEYVLVRTIPGIYISFILFVSWITLLLAKPVLKAKRLFYPDFGSLNLWKPPENLVWGVIGCGIMLLVLPNIGIKIFALNCMLILMTVYFFSGIAIVSFYFEKKQVPRMFRFFLYTLIAIQQMLLLMVIGLGFFDMWLNFRKVDKN